MEFSVLDAEVLRTGIGALSELVTEVRMSCDENGLSVLAMDAANVAMVCWNMPKSSFVKYVPGTEPIGLNLNNLKTILRRAAKEDSVSVEIKDNKAKIVLNGKTRRTFSMPLIQIEEKVQRKPELALKTTMKMSRDQFIDALKDAELVGDAAEFVFQLGKFTIEAKGDLNESVSETALDSAEGENARGKYSLEYLGKMQPKIGDKVVVAYNTDYPLVLKYSTDKCSIEYILAPRVESS